MGRRVFDVRPLRVAAFARLWTASWVTAVGSQLTAVAVPLEIYGFSGSSAYVGLASLAGFVPLVAAALWGGAIADVVDRRRMLLVTSAGIGATSVLLWAQAAASLNSIAVLLPLIAVQQAMFGANAAAQQRAADDGAGREDAYAPPEHRGVAVQRGQVGQLRCGPPAGA